MKIWTAHTRPSSAPVLVREGFSWGALLLGPVWLFARRAWIPAVLLIAVSLAGLLAPAAWRLPIQAAIVVALGFWGRDLWRWSLARRGFTLVHVIAARDEDEALARLLGRRPDLIEAATR